MDAVLVHCRSPLRITPQVDDFDPVRVTGDVAADRRRIRLPSGDMLQIIFIRVEDQCDRAMIVVYEFVQFPRPLMLKIPLFLLGDRQRTRGVRQQVRADDIGTRKERRMRREGSSSVQYAGSSKSPSFTRRIS